MLIVAFCVHGKDEKIEYLQRMLAAKEDRIKQLELMVECLALEEEKGHVMHSRDILFTPRSIPRAREFPGSVQFSVRCTVALYDIT